ncbi:MAG: DNA-binding protein [Bacteroidales bacterium]|nr:DNA-binding protein [Bacteroidales bacterium]MBN2749269.1 DNA-binding protein [Bacteroidales bacterium]
MTKIITFNELRKIKDNLPEGSMHKIAEKLNIDVETVRNYFGGTNYAKGGAVGFHLEPGPDGGVVTLDDTTILELAREIIAHKPEAKV